MEFVKKEDLTGVYRNGRWEYIDYVISIIKRFGYKTFLELGPYDNPVVKDGDTMDIIDKNYPVTYLKDATETPWMIDKYYDCFIALQTFEHLGDKQKEAFREVCKIAGSAILSLPYKHNRPGDCHHGIDEKVIAEWTENIEPESIKIIGDRIVYHFVFESDHTGI